MFVRRNNVRKMAPCGYPWLEQATSMLRMARCNASLLLARMFIWRM